VTRKNEKARVLNTRSPLFSFCRAFFSALVELSSKAFWPHARGVMSPLRIIDNSGGLI
jgi:hypothetical protein